jgi:hypothetical protein
LTRFSTDPVAGWRASAQAVVLKTSGGICNLFQKFRKRIPLELKKEENIVKEMQRMAKEIAIEQ